MDLRITVGEQGQVVLPEHVRQLLALHEGSEIDLHVEGQEVTLKPVKDVQAIQNAIHRYKGSKPGALKAMGFDSVDDYLKATRGR